MSTQQSPACCSVPPVVTSGYEKKGDYQEIGGYKTYVTGPDSTDRGVLSIYDIFGYFDQTLQGADILATSDANKKYKVFMPDWFQGKPVAITDYPPDTKEKQDRLGAFFGKFPPPSIVEKIPAYIDAVKAKNPQIKSWAIIGYCWGGKVSALTVAGNPDLFAAGAQIHPAMVDPEDAKSISKTPFALLASGDEPAEDVKKFESNLSAPHHVETFQDQIHGWMAARGDLSNPRVKEEYTRGYKTLLEFFHKHW